MKLCPVCHHEYAETEQFCTIDGSRLIAAASSRPPQSSPAARLILQTPEGQEREIVISESLVSIGSAQDNSVILSDKSASRHHAQIKWRDGYHFVIDNQSTNGVIVNGKRIGSGEHLLRVSDQIEIGRTKFVYLSAAAKKEPVRDPAEVRLDIPHAPPPKPPAQAPPPAHSRYSVQSTGELILPSTPSARIEESVPGLALDGRYQLEALLSHDSLGALYRARRIALGDRVAVRILRPSLVNDKQALDRFRRQALVAARIRHPNSVQIYDFVTSPDGAVYIVEELLTGQTLSELVKAERGLTLSRIVSIFNQICGAVHAAHLSGIVLRDLTPDTVRVERLVDGREVVKVGGTGLAKLEPGAGAGVTMAGLASALGPAPYMAPELWLNRAPDSRADVYALGVMLFEVLAGEVPFNAATRPEIAQLHVSSTPPDLLESRPDLDESIAAVVNRALSKTPAQRQPTALHLAAELEAAAGVNGGLLGNVFQKATGLLSVRPVVVPSTPAAVAAGEAYLPPVVAKSEEKGQGVFSRVVVALMVEAFLSRVSGGLVKTAVPLYGLLVFGLDISSVMGLVLIQNVVPLTLRPLFGSMADRYGKKNIFVLSLVIRTVVSLLFAVANLPLLFIASALRGIADSAKGPSASAMIADHTDERNIAKAYSWYTTTKSTSGSIGETLTIWLLPFLLAIFLASQTIDARVAVFEDTSRPSGQFERIIGRAGEQSIPADPSSRRIIRVEQRQVKISEVPLDDLPRLVDSSALKKTLTMVFLLSTVFSAVSVVLVMVFIKEKKKDKPKKKPAESGSEKELAGKPNEKAPSVWAFAFLGTVLTAPAYMVTGEFFLILAVKLSVTAKALQWIKLISELFIPLFFGPFFGWVADRIGAGKVIALRSVSSIITSVLFWGTSFFTGSAFFGTLLGIARGLDEIGKAAFKPTWGAVAAKVSSYNLARRGRTMGILEMGVDSSDLIFPQIAGLVFQRFGLSTLMVVRGILAVFAEIYTFIIMRKYRI